MPTPNKMPMAIPAPAIKNVSRRTILSSADRSAPNAARMPNSFFRSLTEYETAPNRPTIASSNPNALKAATHQAVMRSVSKLKLIQSSIVIGRNGPRSSARFVLSIGSTQRRGSPLVLAIKVMNGT